jgi:hypothetical protein
MVIRQREDYNRHPLKQLDNTKKFCKCNYQIGSMKCDKSVE